MTVNVVFLLPGEGDRCRELARQWMAGADLKAFGEGILNQQHLKSVEVNLQAVRWPSTTRPDMAGYAEYFLRVYRREGERYVLAKLENTPTESFFGDPIAEAAVADGSSFRHIFWQ
jgi:hypothetical protein